MCRFAAVDNQMNKNMEYMETGCICDFPEEALFKQGLRMTIEIALLLLFPEGPHIQPLGNWDP